MTALGAGVQGHPVVHMVSDDFMNAYDTFVRAADTGALKVVVSPAAPQQYGAQI